jgi:hypothetical protein
MMKKFEERLAEGKAFAAMIFSGAAMLFAVVNSISGKDVISIRVITVLAVSCALVMIAGFRGSPDGKRTAVGKGTPVGKDG